jgi:hypothetical protein
MNTVYVRKRKYTHARERERIDRVDRCQRRLRGTDVRAEYGTGTGCAVLQRRE